ncbi:MAG TPA: RNA 2',3'-cyclic phosphodiesterase [Pusillimonas sp.]|uniref:RNA 2',3'-cyclic phosphodiesterase n=1 Tax=Pusillimonas sp. TaxID=3040095 RepID=UPI002BD32E59|nr:RNA 2',3'-cyclic phosphodiesterase [Pusillimonas sp.]HUH87249.1 RNA 2',3'-cyclic phosphodiesterase [Pusillimonas sp.]
MPTTGRLFFALWPDDNVARQLVHLQAPLEGGRKSHARDLHLTLAFLGVQPTASLPALLSVVDEIQFSAIDLTLDKYGQFERQKVVWAGTSQVPASLPELRNRLLDMAALRPLNFRREGGFVPHVTLARKTPMPQASFEPIIWRATRFALAESVGGDAVPRYRVLSCRNLEPEVG